MNKGSHLVSLLVLVTFVSLGVGVFSTFVNNRGFTEDRALEAASVFMHANRIIPKRATCAGDSDGAGYGKCNTIVYFLFLMPVIVLL